jgi:hypothetical protein
VLNFRWYRATCPGCLKAIDILPPDSIVAEYHGLAHRCPVCRRWLATYIVVGSKRHPDVRLIETEIAPPGGEPLRRRALGKRSHVVSLRSSWTIFPTERPSCCRRVRRVFRESPRISAARA